MGVDSSDKVGGGLREGGGRCAGVGRGGGGGGGGGGRLT